MSQADFAVNFFIALFALAFPVFLFLSLSLPAFFSISLAPPYVDDGR